MDEERLKLLHAANRVNHTRIAKTTGWMRARVFARARARSQKVELAIQVRLQDKDQTEEGFDLHTLNGQ